MAKFRDGLLGGALFHEPHEGTRVPHGGMLVGERARVRPNSQREEGGLRIPQAHSPTAEALDKERGHRAHGLHYLLHTRRGRGDVADRRNVLWAVAVHGNVVVKDGYGFRHVQPRCGAAETVT